MLPRMSTGPSLDRFVANKEATRAHILEFSTYTLKKLESKEGLG
jgi:hypothetical protein